MHWFQKRFRNKSIPTSEILAIRNVLDGMGRLGKRSLHLDLEIRVTVQAHTVFSDLFGDATSPMLVICYHFEVAWIFHQQLQSTVFQVL